MLELQDHSCSPLPGWSTLGKAGAETKDFGEATVKE